MARTSAAIASQLCEGHVVLHHTPHFKTKASSAPVPGLLSQYQYSNEIAVDLLTGAGLLYNVHKEHLLTYILYMCVCVCTTGGWGREHGGC